MTDFNNVKVCNGFGMTHGFKRCTGRSRRFNEKVIDAAGRFNGRRRKRIKRWCFADGAWQKIELTRHHGVLRKTEKRAGRMKVSDNDCVYRPGSTSMPASLSSVVSFISGSPINAVGSSEDTADISAMPSDSIFAEPAQSKGFSRSI